MFAVGGGCAGLPILASSSSFLPLQLFWLPPSPPGVVMELLHRKIIPQGVRMSISRTDSPRQQNELLHERLFRTCTYTALKTVCEVICNVVGNPKMTLLGQDMMMCLETGQWCYGCVVYMHVSISSMVLKRCNSWPRGYHSGHSFDCRNTSTHPHPCPRHFSLPTY